MPLQFASPDSDAVPIWFVTGDGWPAIQTAIGTTATRYAAACGFEPKPGRLQLLPGDDGGLAGALFGLAEKDARGRDRLAAGRLATGLPAGTYRFANAAHEPQLAALAFLLGLYRFERYRADPAARPQLVAPEGVDAARLAVGINGHGFVADTSQGAADIAFPPYAEAMTRIGRERGWPGLTRAQFEAGRAPNGHLTVGTPAEAIAKILAQHAIFGHQRYLMQMRVGQMPHAAVMRSIELFGTVVAPAVRQALAQKGARAGLTPQ